MLHHTMNHTMKDSITIPLTLIRHYLTEGQLAVLISHNKRQLKGKVVFSSSVHSKADSPNNYFDSSEYSITYKKLYYNDPVSGDNILLYYSGNVNITSPQIDFAGAYHKIEINLSLKNGKVKNVSANNTIAHKGIRPPSLTPFRSNYENRFLKMLKRLLSCLKSLFKK